MAKKEEKASEKSSKKEEIKPTSSSGSNLFSVRRILTVVAIAIAIWYYQKLQSPQDSNPDVPITILNVGGVENYYETVPDHGPEYVKYPWVNGHVSRMEWGSDENFANLVAEIGQPLVFRNTPAENWRARKFWGRQYFMHNNITFQHVQMHPDKTFSYFHADHPMSELVGIVEDYKKGTYAKKSMDAEQFFFEMSKTPPYHYFAGNADELGSAYNDLFPVDPFMVKNETWTPENSHLFRWTNVWIGPAGATTHTHYDISENFYVQIYGKKRFILFPPEDYENLYLYPFLHPGAQQSQVRFDDLQVERFPHFKRASALEAVLEPGDVLYLPPFWFHHVSALTTSISASVWTKFPEVETMYETTRAPLPLKKGWSKERMILASKIYLRKVIEGLYGPPNGDAFVAQVVETRWADLFKRFPKLEHPSETRYCKNDLLPNTEEDILEEVGPVFMEMVMEQVQRFGSVPNDGRRNIWLGNLCEQVAHTAVGIENAGAYLNDFSC